ncbi:MAG: nucleotidyltransferase family protein [Thermoplasmata archaeon]|nr:nucleotidyltransferase family protein [Thermoplasmata archaeon]
MSGAPTRRRYLNVTARDPREADTTTHAQAGPDRKAPEPAQLRCVILAAGASERFGGYPKALLRVGTETALERVARLSRGVSQAPMCVVVAADSVTGAAARKLSNSKVVENPRPELGRTGSLLVGLETVPFDSDVLVWPVDHPLVEAMTLRALVEAATSDPMATWLIPSWSGLGGHPILFTREARPTVDRLSAEQPLRDVLPALGVGVRRVAVPDPGVLDNLDTPESYHRALSAWAERTGGV